MSLPPRDDAPKTRAQWRQSLLERRARFAASASAAEAGQALTRHLRRVLAQLEPTVLGVYWAMRHEFNATAALTSMPGASEPALSPQWALPYAQRTPVQMHYRTWDAQTPRVRDECTLPSSDGAPVVPDVVLVPCVGYTRAGFRLGYGGGYFDRWLAAHPGVTSVGVSWAVGTLDDGSIQVLPV